MFGRDVNQRRTRVEQFRLAMRGRFFEPPVVRPRDAARRRIRRLPEQPIPLKSITHRPRNPPPSRVRRWCRRIRRSHHPRHVIIEILRPRSILQTFPLPRQVVRQRLGLLDVLPRHAPRPRLRKFIPHRAIVFTLTLPLTRAHRIPQPRRDFARAPTPPAASSQSVPIAVDRDVPRRPASTVSV